MFWFDEFKEELRRNNIRFHGNIEFLEFIVRSDKGYPIRFFIDTEGDFFEFSAYATIGVSNTSIDNYEIMNKYNNIFRMFKFSFTEPGNIRLEVDIPNRFYKSDDYTFFLIRETIKIVDEIGPKFIHYRL